MQASGSIFLPMLVDASCSTILRSQRWAPQNLSLGSQEMNLIDVILRERGTYSHCISGSPSVTWLSEISPSEDEPECSHILHRKSYTNNMVVHVCVCVCVCTPTRAFPHLGTSLLRMVCLNDPTPPGSSLCWSENLVTRRPRTDSKEPPSRSGSKFTDSSS